MISPNDSVCIALSGGADSVSLFHFLVTNKQELNINEIYACHINHMLRGVESDSDEAYVRELCREYGVKLFVKSFDIKKLSSEHKMSIEETARNARYNYFEEISKKCSCKIATAHTISDSMETTIFNLSRGSGLKGLCGISASRDYIIRPLIYCTRKDVEDYCAQNNLKFVIDSTNCSDDYSRNKIRHKVIPILYRLNQSLDKAFLHFYNQGEEDEDFLETITDNAIKNMSVGTCFSRNEYLKQHKSIKFRVLAKILSDEKIEVSYNRLELLDNYINSGEGAVQLNLYNYLKIKGDYFEISSNDIEFDYFEVKLPKLMLNETAEFIINNTKKVRFTLKHCEQNKNFENISNIGLKKQLDYDRINGDVYFRQRKEGDKIHLHKRNCTKTLKQLFNEMKLNQIERSKEVVLCDAMGLIWVENVGCSSKVAVDSATKNILIISLEETIC